MLLRNAWPILQACLLASLASCAPIAFGQQELFLRHDAKADSLDLLIAYDAIQSNHEDASVSSGFATRVSGGHRAFMIFDWPLHFDLGDIEHKLEDQDAGEPDPWRAWERELVKGLKGIKVTASGYYRENRQLGLSQCLRIPDASQWISLFDRALFVAIEDSVARGAFETEFDLFDARTRELWIAMAKEKRDWLSLKDGVLSVDLPATGACAARMFGGLVKGTLENAERGRFFSGLVSHVTDLKIADEHVILRWKLEGPTFTFAAPSDRPYDDRLARGLRDSNALPEALPQRSEVVEPFSEH